MKRALKVAAQYRKAIGGGVAGGLAVLLGAFPNSLALQVTAGVLAGSGVVSGLPNRRRPRREA